MTPSPTLSLDGEAGLQSWQALYALDNILNYMRAPNEHPYPSGAAEVIRTFVQQRAAIPALPPDTGKQAVQFQRRRGIGDGSGGFKWCEWQVCTEQDARRIASLRSWQWRKIVMPAASQPAPTPDAAPLSIEDAVALVRAKANAGYGYGPKGSRDEFDRCYSLSPLQLATVINAARAASMQDTSSPQSPKGGA